ncbi:MAG: alpha/beta fold hydrolase [Actinomycetia bacterium]|nr:alpha/beta fold hydrolase [Actinomycetes bacterium]
MHSLQWFRTPAEPRGVVLLLHGGQEASEEAVSRWGHPVLRMVPFALSLRRRRHRLAVGLLRYAVRGWNAEHQSPVADVRWALDETRRRYPGAPIVLVGHSMGARAALHVMDAPDVQVVVALAAWVAPGDPVLGRRGLKVYLGHGTDDRITAPRGSQYLAKALQEKGTEVTLELVDGEGHALLRKARWWHRRVTAYVMESVQGLEK